MTNTQAMEFLLTHVQLQAVIHKVEIVTALDYAWINFQRNTEQISTEDYYNAILDLTATVATTEDLWQHHLDFSQLVTTLTNEYYLNYLFESEQFLNAFDLEE